MNRIAAPIPLKRSTISRAISDLPPSCWSAAAEPGIASLDIHRETPMSGTEEEQQHQYSSEWLESVDWDGWDKPAPPPVIFGGDQKREQTELVRVIGARMQEARDLCNLSQSEAARRLGYSNSSKLSKVEGATDTNSVPLWLIVRAAKVYEVSIDFLFGLTDDWEIGVPRGVQGFMFDVWEKARQRDMAALEHLHREVVAVSSHTAELVVGIAGATDALATLRTRAPDFDDLPASASLAGRLERLQERARAADAALRRFRLGLSPDTSRTSAKGATR